MLQVPHRAAFSLLSASTAAAAMRMCMMSIPQPALQPPGQLLFMAVSLSQQQQLLQSLKNMQPSSADAFTRSSAA